MDEWCNVDTYDKFLSRKRISRPILSHTISEEAAKKWINAHCFEEGKQAAKLFLNATTYVSFDDFLIVLKRLATTRLLPLLSDVSSKWVPLFYDKYGEDNFEKSESLWIMRWMLKLAPEIRKFMCGKWSQNISENLRHGISTLIIFTDVTYENDTKIETLIHTLDYLSELNLPRLINVIYFSPFITSNAIKILNKIRMENLISGGTNLIILYESIIPSLSKLITDEKEQKLVSSEIGDKIYPFIFQHRKPNQKPYLGIVLPSSEATDTKCPERKKIQRLDPLTGSHIPEPWSKTRIAYDPTESDLELFTLPAGTILMHERQTQFPVELQNYPRFAYNWYSSRPFYSGSSRAPTYPTARYTYQVKHDIPNLIWFDDWEDLDGFQDMISQIYPKYKKGIGQIADYAVAAFICQVLKNNGFIIHRVDGIPPNEDVRSKNMHDIVVLCGPGDIHLQLINIELFNDPKIHPGYSSATTVTNIPEDMMKLTYTDEESDLIRSSFPFTPLSWKSLFRE